MAASCVIHAAIGLYVGSSAGWLLFVAEVGRNSQAKISQEGNNVPPKKLEVFLQAIDPTIVAENAEAKSPTEENVRRETIASEVKQPMAAADKVLVRPDEAPFEVEKPTPVPKARENAAPQDDHLSKEPPRPERSKLDPEFKSKKVKESAAAMASAGSEPSRGADVDRPPHPVLNAAPEYPLAALKARVAGRVLVRVRVGLDGRVLKAEIHRSSGVTVLDEAALKAVKAWKFEPAQRGGVPTEEEIAVPVKFVIAETKSPK